MIASAPSVSPRSTSLPSSLYSQHDVLGREGLQRVLAGLHLGVGNAAADEEAEADEGE